VQVLGLAPRCDVLLWARHRVGTLFFFRLAARCEVHREEIDVRFLGAVLQDGLCCFELDEALVHCTFLFVQSGRCKVYLAELDLQLLVAVLHDGLCCFG
jgi:hypothetical protein